GALRAASTAPADAVPGGLGHSAAVAVPLLARAQPRRESWCDRLAGFGCPRLVGGRQVRSDLCVQDPGAGDAPVSPGELRRLLAALWRLVCRGAGGHVVRP